MRRRSALVLAWALLATLAVSPCNADDRTVGSRVAAVIDRVKTYADKDLKKAAKALKEGRTKDARELLKSVVATLEAGVHATHNAAGKKPPAEAFSDSSKPKPKPAPSKKSGRKRPVPAAPAHVLEEKFDRFTGEAAVSVSPSQLSAHHKDTTEKAEVWIKYMTLRMEGRASEYVIYFASNDIGWNESSGMLFAYLLIDGRRLRWPLHRTAVQDLGGALQQTALRLDDASKDRILSATKVEIRLGDFDFEIPPPYRAAAVKANSALARLMKQGK